MIYENQNTNRRRQGGTRAAADGTVLREGRKGAASEGAVGGKTKLGKGEANLGAVRCVDSPTFMAAAVMLAIEAFLSKKEGGAA